MQVTSKWGQLLVPPLLLPPVLLHRCQYECHLIRPVAAHQEPTAAATSAATGAMTSTTAFVRSMEPGMHQDPAATRAVRRGRSPASPDLLSHSPAFTSVRDGLPDCPSLTVHGGEPGRTGSNTLGKRVGKAQAGFDLESSTGNDRSARRPSVMREGCPNNS